jgi:hypothetical protein
MAIAESEKLNRLGGIYIRKLPEPSEITKEIDKKTWRLIFNVSGMESLMNATQKAAFVTQVDKNPPAVTVNRVQSTLVTQYSCRDSTFIEGMVDTFTMLDSDFKTNKPFKIGHKIIFKGAGDRHGYWASHNSPENMMIDLERIIHIINKRKPPVHGKNITNKLYEYLSTADVVELDFMRCKTFKNGNVHIEVTCKGTINRINEIIADHYGHSLPKTYH